MKILSLVPCFLFLLCEAWPCHAGGAFVQLSDAGNISLPDVPAPVLAGGDEFTEAEQYLPPDNNEPGFRWPERGGMKSLEGEHFFYTASRPVNLLSSPWDPARPACELEPGTRYEITSEPSFVGEYVKVRFIGEASACPVRGGFMLMPDVRATSAGGIWELPDTVRAFLDTIAYAEGTKWRYNYIFTFATFESYYSHPDRRICAGRLCSTAAGRYQFLTSTWKGLASSLRLEDFSPPSQDKACLEVIRRAGAYGLVLNSGKYENFAAAMKKLNRTWASLPGSPYGQPTHTTSELWKVYNGALSR